MGIKFSVHGDITRVVNIDQSILFDKLKPAVYTVQFNPLMGGYFLQKVKDRFNTPAKVYGQAYNRSEKIIHAYKDRDRNTGVFLTGNKGAGKTLLAEYTCNRMIDEENTPVILINKPFNDEGFFSFIVSLGECVLFFDEFTKTYGNQRTDEEDGTDNQNSLLTFFDGAYSTKRLSLLVENESSGINKYFKDRPGRVYYHFKYSHLEDDVVRDYCLDNGVNEDKTDEIIAIARTVFSFSFDILKAIVEEVKRYDLPVVDLIQDLNFNYFEKEYELEILKVVHKRTGIQAKVNNEKSFIVKKPSYGSNPYIWLVMTDELRPHINLKEKPNTGLVTFLMHNGKIQDEQDRPEHNGTAVKTAEKGNEDFEIRIAPNELVSHSREGNVLVYDEGSFLVYAKEIEVKHDNKLY